MPTTETFKQSAFRLCHFIGSVLDKRARRAFKLLDNRSSLLTGSSATRRATDKDKTMPSNNIRYRNYKERARIRAWLLKTQTHCAICGGEIDKTLKCPHPASAVVDEIVPVTKGGSPIDPANVQLVHWKCNARKSDSMPQQVNEQGKIKPSKTKNLATLQSRRWI